MACYKTHFPTEFVNFIAVEININNNCRIRYIEHRYA